MIQDDLSILTLRAAQTELAIAPHVGGSIIRYLTKREGQTYHWMRSTPTNAIENRNPGAMSSFPLVPFSNRIRNATFRFRGRTIQLDQNFRPEPHAIHGHGWRAPWTVTNQTETTLSIEYEHLADDWPWSYRAEQHFTLLPDRLTVRFTVTNNAPDTMPVGFGLHPYFVRTPNATVRANVAQMWQADRNSMPSTQVEPPPQLLLSGAGLNPDDTPLDNNFTGFGGNAIVAWPEWNAGLRITTDPIYRCLVVYTPTGQDFFCVEPATNCIDGFNLAADGQSDTGIIELGPNDTAGGDVTFEPVALAR